MRHHFSSVLSKIAVKKEERKHLGIIFARFCPKFLLKKNIMCHFCQSFCTKRRKETWYIILTHFYPKFLLQKSDGDIEVSFK